MSKSIRHQIYTALENGYAPGASKRSYRIQNNGTGYKIFSLAYLRDLHHTGNRLAAFLMREYGHVTRVRDIPEEAWQEFINEIAGTGIKSQTVNKLRSHLAKIQKCIHTKFGIKRRVVGTKNPLPRSEKLRDKPMPVSVSEALKRVVTKPVANCIFLGQTLGLRMREAVEVRKEAFHLIEGEGQFGFGYVSFKKQDGPKHGRPRVIDVRSLEDMQALIDILRESQGPTAIAKKDGSGYRRGSIYTAMTRGMRKLGIAEEWTQNKMHAIRKTTAQGMYDFMRYATRDSMPEDESKRKALQFANRQIGHNRWNDKALNDTYVKDRW